MCVFTFSRNFLHSVFVKASLILVSHHLITSCSSSASSRSHLLVRASLGRRSAPVTHYATNSLTAPQEPQVLPELTAVLHFGPAWFSLLVRASRLTKHFLQVVCMAAAGFLGYLAVNLDGDKCWGDDGGFCVRREVKVSKWQQLPFCSRGR